MREFTDKTAPHQLAFEAFGIEMRICSNSAELLTRVQRMIPPGSQPRRRSPTQKRIGLLDEGNDLYSIYNYDGVCIHDAPGREYALMMLESQIESHVALEAPDFIFIHAGVVSDGDRAIVMPGSSFAGKTTLVRALVEAGAVYYSDEYAVLDATGLVHPYAKPLSFRPPYEASVDYDVEQLGGVAGLHPLPIGFVIVTSYEPDAEWDPEHLSPGAGALAMLENAIPAQERPEQAMLHIRNAIADATTLRGSRGEASEMAPVLLDMLRTRA